MLFLVVWSLHQYPYYSLKYYELPNMILINLFSAEIYQGRFLLFEIQKYDLPGDLGKLPNFFFSSYIPKLSS